MTDEQFQQMLAALAGLQRSLDEDTRLQQLLKELLAIKAAVVEMNETLSRGTLAALPARRGGAYWRDQVDA